MLHRLGTLASTRWSWPKQSHPRGGQRLQKSWVPPQARPRSRYWRQRDRARSPITSTPTLRGGFLRSLRQCVVPPHSLLARERRLPLSSATRLANHWPDGWSKDEIRSFLAEHSRISAEELEAAGILLELDSAHNMVPEEDGLLPSVSSPDDILLVTAGGPGAGWSAYMPAWAPKQHSRATSRLVTEAGHSEIIGGKDV